MRTGSRLLAAVGLPVYRLPPPGLREAPGGPLIIVSGMASLLSILLLAFSPWTASALAAGDSPRQFETVVLIHGLARTDRSMRPLEVRLTKAGFAVHNLRYRSTRKAPEGLVREVAQQIAECCSAAGRLHFVGHSLGGILVRAHLGERPPDNLGRVVLLAPPNHGSEIVDRLGAFPPFRWILGRTALQLGTDPESFPNRLPTPTFEVGVIAGTTSLNPFGFLLLPGPSDGTVSVTSTKLEGMTDFLEVSHSHTFIMRSAAVAEQVIHFLRHGRFRRYVAE